ncbi:hypothetical protein OF83DRAFT_401593 [Amylostereum chailletii]|nr:hypothetical protein OF83DRAFT_401593 [Amylostereum chailletii]
MSSDGYFEDDMDDAFFNELDTIEATQLQSPPITQQTEPSVPVSRPPRSTATPIAIDDDDYFDMTFDVDESELQKLDHAIQDIYAGKPAPAPVAGPSRSRSFARVPSKGGRQTTLFGEVLPQTKPPSKSAESSRPTTERTKSAGQRELFRKTKKWDHTAFAKSGSRRKQSDKGKGKGKALPDDDAVEEEEVEFEQFPAPFVSIGPVQCPMLFTRGHMAY